MYQKAYGIIETLAPLHVGASAGEESGNLNLIFRDQFTQTGIIPGSSIRGRFRADMRQIRKQWQLENPDQNPSLECQESYWYGAEAKTGVPDSTTEALIKFEYASLIWLPIFCPGQPIVWVTCPYLLKRYLQITKINATIPQPYTASRGLNARPVGNNRQVLFFNLGFLEIQRQQDLSAFIPQGVNIPNNQLVVLDNNDMAMVHDMGLYRQSRVAMEEGMKKAKKTAFFEVEALPEGSILIFPIALKQNDWSPFPDSNTSELYLGGLESIGFGRTQVTLTGEYFN